MSSSLGKMQLAARSIPLFALIHKCLPAILLMQALPMILATQTQFLDHEYQWDIKYETVKGHFIQDDPTVDPTSIPAVPPRFGLIDSSPSRWTNFVDQVSDLNKQAPPNVVYKVFFLGRHGQGWHNAAELHYGQKAWDDHWARLNTDGNMTWGPDADLTPLGIEQARYGNQVWKEELDGFTLDDVWQLQSKSSAPLPQRLYSSPLTRAAMTMELVYGDILMSPKSIKPLIVENIREVMGVHTCDKRRTKTYLQHRFPLYDIEDGFSEEDILWSPDHRETIDERNVRVRGALDKIFNEIWDDNDSTYIGITAHGGTIAAALYAFNHREFRLSTGSIIPVLVKASRGKT